jgi:hypothetical protein
LFYDGRRERWRILGIVERDGEPGPGDVDRLFIVERG